MLSEFRKLDIIMRFEDISNWDSYRWYQSSGLGVGIRLGIVDLGVKLTAMMEMYVLDMNVCKSVI